MRATRAGTRPARKVASRTASPRGPDLRPACKLNGASATPHSTVSAETLERTHAIWDALADQPAGRIDEAANYLMHALCELHACDYAAWIGSVRLPVVPDGDPLRGWRPVALQQLKRRDPLEARFKRSRKLIAIGDISLTTVRHAQMAGTFRATRLCDLVEAGWFESKHYKGYLQNNVADVATIVFPVSERAESYFLFGRNARQPRFDEQTRDGLAYALRGLRWFHRRLLLFYGLLCSRAPLTLTERKVLRCLLAGAADKDIAAELQIGLHSARDHVATLYRKFDVSSRTELMALWIGPRG